MWKLALLKEMQDPKITVFSDERISVLPDKFRKAEVHFLVLPHENISNLSCVKRKDLELLKYMESKGMEIAEQYGSGRTFKFGYHAEPSMERLHLHVVSDDMNSTCLKRREHWNSYTTPFFMNSEDVIEELERSGKITIPTKKELESFIKTPLKCHKCDYVPINLTHLKKHLLIHVQKRNDDA